MQVHVSPTFGGVLLFIDNFGEEGYDWLEWTPILRQVVKHGLIENISAQIRRVADSWVKVLGTDLDIGQLQRQLFMNYAV